MKLPPVDEFRAPFVEPIGHLAMQAARAEQLVFSLLGCIPFDGSEDQMAPGEIEQQVRSWDSVFISGRLALIHEQEHRKNAGEAIDQFIRLKDFRHRVIHDAVEVGIGFDGKAFALAVEYRREKKSPSVVYCHPVGPQQIADLACEFYELTKDLDAIIYDIRHRATRD